MFERKGFTLIEILFVIVVIGILAAIVIPRLQISIANAREAACDANMANINSNIERYFYLTGSWPAQDLNEMLPPTTYNYFPDGLPTCPVSGSAYEMDPTTNRVYEAAAHDHTP